jgi:plastocyanin
MKTIFSLLLVTALIAGCGGDDETTTTEPAAGTTSTETTPSTSTEDTAGGDVAITMKDIAFDPAETTAKVGQKVVWTNEDDIQHDADSTGGEEFETDLIGKGGTVEFTPTKAGTIEYVCSVHPNMTGKITVE